MKIELNRDQIKYVAMFTMLLNHIANVFLEPGTFLFEVMVDVGYFTAITMCYFLVEGYGLHSLQREIRQTASAVCPDFEIPFCLAFTEEGTISFVSMNMLFTLFLCFLILYAWKKSLQEPGRHSASWAWYLPPPTATGPFLPLSSPIGSQAVASGMHRGKIAASRRPEC